MLKNTTYLFAGLLSTVFIFSGCGNDPEKETTTTSVNQDSTQTDSVAKGGKIFSLPAPMQVVSAIKGSGAKYSEDYLCPIKNNFSSEFSKSLTLGIYSVDLGYANVYEQAQTSLNYFSAAAKIVADKNIVGCIDASKVKRFKDNLNSKDSLTRFTLSSFNDIHNYLVENNQVDDAYLIITGCFIEGVYISSIVCEKTKSKDMVSLVGQQKLFLESLLELLSNHQEKKEMPELFAKLSGLKQIYDQVEIKYTPIANSKNKKMEPVIVSDEALAKISEKIKEIRTGIIQ